MEKDSPSEGITALAGGGSSGGVTGQPNAKPAEAPKQRMMNPEQFLKRQQSFLMNSDANKNPREHVLEVFFNSAKITNFETFGEPGAGVLSASFSPSPSEDKYIAASKGNGEVDIYSLDTCKKKYTIRNPQRRVPFTMVKWRPRPEGSGFCTNNVLGTVNTDGQIQHWHMATGKCISTIPPEYEEESQLFGLDYSENARKLVVCGQYPVVGPLIT